MNQARHTLLAAILLLSASGCDGNGSGVDTTPPAVPRGLVAAVTGTTVKVFWLSNNDADFSHYLLYMGTRSDSLYDIGEELTLTSKFMSDLTPGVTYYFAVSAVDDAGNESDRSDTVQAVSTSAGYATSLGWSAFTAGDYSTALGHFQTARNLEENHAEAYLGLGWCHLFLDEHSNARVEFSLAITNGWATVEPHAGLAVVCREIPDLETAISHALTVVTSDPDWIFEHMTTIDWRDMRLLLAQCWFRLGEEWFDEAQAQVDILDPANGLDPSDPATWSVGGTTFDSYGAALMTAIMELESLISG